LDEKHNQLPVKVLSPAEACDEEWGMNAFGKYSSRGAIHVISE
jgi:hypothetical protein